MEIILTVIFTLLGIAVGSFLNVCIDRLPLRQSLVSPPSRCDVCEHRLSPVDLVPVFSYILLRGRCRYCRARIPFRILLVEICSGALFFLAFWRFGLSVEFAITAVYCCLFLVIMFIDWEHKLILNRVTYPAAIVALIILGIDSLLPEPSILSNLGFIPETSILSGIIAGAIGRFVGGNLTMAVLVLVWSAAFLSGVIANIPFTAAMLPVVGFLTRTIPGASGSPIYDTNRKVRGTLSCDNRLCPTDTTTAISTYGRLDVAFPEVRWYLWDLANPNYVIGNGFQFGGQTLIVLLNLLVFVSRGPSQIQRSIRTQTYPTLTGGETMAQISNSLKGGRCNDW